MRFNAKKILAVLSSVVLSFNILCTSIYSAEETQPIVTSSVQTGTELTVQGTNAFGNMLAAELQSAQDEQIENEGQNIFSIEMTGKTATVEYDVIEDCSVVVGIYDESGTTMLASGNADVSADNNIAQLTIDIDTMPQYYYIKAFLINKQTMRPLCSVYENPMYTQEMQEFLAKTTDDFESDKVYNLDDDNTNNFAVFKDNVTVLDTEPIYSGSGSAVFDSITDDIRSLSAGDTFAYYYEDALYIYSVTAVTLDEENGLAEITFIDDSSTDLEDVFDYVKVDGESLAENCTATPTGDADESVTYLGMSTETPAEQTESGNIATDDVDISGSVTVSHDFKIEKKFVSEAEGSPVSAEGKLTASLKFSATASAKVYITLSKQYVELKLDYSAKISASASGSMALTIPLGQELCFAICPGVYIGITPSFIAEMSAKVSFEGTLSGTFGFKCDGKSLTNISTTPKFDTKLKVDGKFFIGFSLEPRLNIVSDKLAYAGANAKVGAEITASSNLFEWDSAQLVKHNCNECISGKVSGKLQVDLTLKFLDLDNMTFTLNLPEVKVKVFDYYYSDINGFNIGTCPNKSYKTIITVYDNNRNAVNNAVITVDDSVISRDSYETELYLTQGLHMFSVESPSYRTYTACASIVAAANEPNRITITVYPTKHSGSGGISNSNGGSGGGGGSSWGDDPNIDIGIEKNRLSLGGNHSAYITTNGDLYMWGDNYYGQLGDGTPTNRSKPVKIMSNVAQVSLGFRHSACITTNGDLYTWGDNYYGQLGDETTTNRSKPVKIMSNVAQVSLGIDHSACITQNGDLYIWGGNFYGQLGDGTTTNRSKPVKIMSNVAQVSLGSYHSAYITAAGDLYTWGYNYYGQLGDGTTTDRHTPIKIMSNVAQVNFNFEQSSCKTTKGDIYIWGYTFVEPIGVDTATDSYSPVKIMSNIARISFGRYHIAYITTNGDLYTFGSNDYGQLGDGTRIYRGTPVKIMSNVAQVSLGGAHSACITTNGDLYTWGDNDSGQLGNGSTIKRWSSPTQITIPTETTADLVTDEASDSPIRQFTGLLPNEVYNIYSMNSRTAEEPFGADNLLYIDQKISDNEGNLSVEITTNKSGVAPEIFVKAMTGGEIDNAEITSLEQSEGSASFGWAAVEGADKYTVYVIRNGIFFKQADTTELSYTVDGLTPGTEYGFIIQAWVNGEYSVLDKSDALYIIPEKEKTIADYIAIVNSIPDGDNVILTDEQLEAIEKVLEYDYNK